MLKEDAQFWAHYLDYILIFTVFRGKISSGRNCTYFLLFSVRGTALKPIICPILVGSKVD